MRLGVAAALVDGALVPGDVEVDGGAITAVGLVRPPGRGVAAPGFVDLQVNGFAGVDFMHTDRAGYAQAGEAMLATGTTAYQPTFITAAGGGHSSRRCRRCPTAASGPCIIGAHVEGPFISPRRLGVHPPQHQRAPDPALLERILGGGRRAPGDARAGAAGRVRADRPAARARRRRVGRAHRRERGRGAPRVRPRRAHRDAPVQRDAAARAARPGHRARGARPARRDGPADRRRPPRRRRHAARRLAGRARADRARHRRRRRDRDG